MDEKFDLEHAVRKTIEIIQGAYAIAAISSKEPEKIVATRKDSPLIVGLGDNGYYLASDSPAILKYAKDIIYPEKGEIVIVDKEGVVVHDEFDNVVNKEIETINWTPEMAEKEGYDHFMIKEINEQATAVKNTLTQQENIQQIIDDIGCVDIQSADCIGCQQNGRRRLNLTANEHLLYITAGESADRCGKSRSHNLQFLYNLFCDMFREFPVCKGRFAAAEGTKHHVVRQIHTGYQSHAETILRDKGQGYTHTGNLERLLTDQAL
jgi:hypothetical protein